MIPKKVSPLFLRVCLAALSSPLNAEDPLPDPKKAFGNPIVLGPDDKPAFDAPPTGFNAVKDVPHGELAMVEYDSKTVGTKRKM